MKSTAFINNIEYAFNEGETILKFVHRIEQQNIIPTLCDAPNLDPFGSCRVCSVAVALEKNGKSKKVGV